MGVTKKNLLITGLPGIGKTTLIKKLSEELKHFHPAGFYTEEIREEGQRKGFELISLDGKRGLLSHKDIKSPYRVGPYGAPRAKPEVPPWNTLLRQGFGGLPASGEIRRSINASARE